MNGKKKNQEPDSDAEGEETKKNESDENDENEDLKYYRQEIGQEPDSGFFLNILFFIIFL